MLPFFGRITLAVATLTLIEVLFGANPGQLIHASALLGVVLAPLLFLLAMKSIRLTDLIAPLSMRPLTLGQRKLSYRTYRTIENSIQNTGFLFAVAGVALQITRIDAPMTLGSAVAWTFLSLLYAHLFGTVLFGGAAAKARTRPRGSSNREISRWIAGYSPILLILGCIRMMSALNKPESYLPWIALSAALYFTGLALLAWSHGRNSRNGMRLPEMRANPIFPLSAPTIATSVAIVLWAIR